MYNSIENDYSHHTENELEEKCLILVLMLFYLSLQCLYESGLIYNDTLFWECKQNKTK